MGAGLGVSRYWVGNLGCTWGGVEEEWLKASRVNSAN